MKEFIKNFIERNKPIFAIGLVTFTLFIGIIIYYRIMPHKETSLTKVGNESNYNIMEDESNLDDSELYTNTQPSISIEQSLDEKVGILDIEFTQTGFTPKISRSIQGQAVRWTNKTDKTIYLKQKTPTYNELTELVQIDPEQSFNYRLTQPGTWNYEEDISKSFGTIEVYKFSN